MKKVVIYVEQNPWVLYLSTVVLLFPALLINLGLFPSTSDEHIRGLVALEMEIRDQFIIPTMYGEYYLKKPPLFNWMLIAYHNLFFDGYTEFSMRSLTVIFTLVYGFSIFYILRKHFGSKFGFVAALIFITSGRMLFWDTQLALIDITYSWIVFLNFMVIYHYFKKGKFWHLFLISYFLTAIGYMFKGLPSLVFEGTTLLVFFIYKRRFLKLISWEHLAGFMVLLLIVGGYYLAFFLNFPGTIEDVFATLFDESSRRTVLRFGWQRTVIHFFTFPFEQFYHFFPWSLLIIACFRRDFFKILRRNDFILYNALIFIANILIYWSSPEVYPRYLLMMAPLIFNVFLYYYYKSREENNFRYKVVDYFLIFAAITGSLGSLIFPFLEQTDHIPLIWLKSIALFLSLGFLSYLIIKIPQHRILIFGLIMLIVRIGFNWTVLEARAELAHDIQAKAGAIELAIMTKGEPLHIYDGTPVDDFSAFYITRERKKLLTRVRENYDKDAWYIMHPRYMDSTRFKEHYRYKMVWDRTTALLVKFRDQTEK